LVLALAPSAGALGVGDALGLGLGFGVGVVLAWASPASERGLAAVRTTRVDQRPMPGGRFRFNVGPPQQIRDDNDVRDVHSYAGSLSCVRQGRKTLKILRQVSYVNV